MISILCPTRKRPAEFIRMCISAHDTTSTEQIQILAYCDDDDQSLGQLVAPYLKVITGPRIIMSDMWNKLIPYADGDILMLGSDDVIFRTIGWDKLVADSFRDVEDKILMVHGSDFGGHFSRFGTHPIVHRRWVEALGYFTPKCFSSDYADTWLNDIANELGRRKYIKAIFEHMHPLYKKAALDSTYRENLDRHDKDNVDDLYELTKPDRDEAVAILRKLMFSTPDTKDWLAPAADDPPAGSIGECPRCGKWATVQHGYMKACNACGLAYR
jgi:hypothetical protein